MKNFENFQIREFSESRISKNYGNGSFWIKIPRVTHKSFKTKETIHTSNLSSPNTSNDKLSFN
jgi:hypothetical protein